MAVGTVTWFAQGLLDLGNKIHDLDADTLRLGIVTSAVAPDVGTVAPHWGGTGTTNFATNQVATNVGYTGPIALTGVTWGLVGSNPTLRAQAITIPLDAGGFTNATFGILYNDSDVNKRALGFIDLSGGVGTTVGNTTAPISVDWFGSTNDVLGMATNQPETPPPPSTLASLVPGQWYAFPSSNMSAVDPCPAKNCPYSGTIGQRGVMEAWSSGCYDTIGNRLLCWGGGHGDYGGNEVYAFGPITADNPTWTRLSEPSNPVTTATELYPDGTPSSRHNYGTVQFDPVGNRMFSLSGGSVFSPGNATASRECHSFDLTTLTWKTDWPDWLVGDNHNTATEWDSVNQRFWVKNSFSNAFGGFNPAGNGGLGAWGLYGPNWYSSPYMTLAVDTRRNKIFGIGGNPVNNNGLNVIDMNNGFARSNPVSSGNSSAITLEESQAPGFVYDPIGDRFLAWRGGLNVYSLNPVTYEWTVLTNSSLNAVNPGTATANGVFGRFRYVPALGGLITVNSNTGSVHFYKLHNTTPITTVDITSTSAALQTNVVSTFGQVFKQGDVPANCGVTIKDSVGNIIPSQCNRKATHADGSLRHAVITVTLPSLNPLATQTLSMYASVAGAEAAPTSPSALVTAGFDAVVSCTIGGVPYTASAADLLGSTTPTYWLTGKDCNEYVVSGPLRDASLTAHPHLQAYFHVRAYGTSKARVQVVVENDWAYEPSPTTYTYDLNITVGGVSKLTTAGLKHYHHARWVKTYWWGTEPLANVKHNKAYFLSTKAVPNFDQTIPVLDSKLDLMVTRWNQTATLTNTGDSNNRVGPMGMGILHPTMPDTSGRQDIGPTPAWTATYLLSFDQRAKDTVVNSGYLGGSWPMHYRDKNTGKPLSLDNWPYATILGGHSDTFNPLTGLYEDFPALVGTNTNPFTVDSAHQPEIAYVPYLVTGDYYLLEELQFWASWNMFKENPAYRGNISGYVRHDQIRGQAWSLRTLGWAAYITPDNDALKSYFTTRVANNIADYNQRFVVENPNQLGAAISYTNFFFYSLVYDTWAGANTGIAGWQDDYHTWAIGNLVDLGFSTALPVLQWRAKFAVGRMTDPGFCYIDGVGYNIAVMDAPNTALYTSFAQLWERNFGQLQELDVGDSTYLQFYRDQPFLTSQQVTWINNYYGTNAVVGQFISTTTSPQYYPAYMRPAVAVAKDSGITNAALAWSTYIAAPKMPATVGWINQSTGYFEPQFAISPRT